MFYIVEDRAFTSRDEAENYCLECDFDYSCIIEAAPTEDYSNDYSDELIEELEERQHKSGFYAFQDMMELYRSER